MNNRFEARNPWPRPGLRELSVCPQKPAACRDAIFLTSCRARAGLNPKQYGNSNLECSKHVLDFGHLEFEFVSSFGIRISDFDLVFGDAKTFARLCKEFLGDNTRWQ